MILERLDRIVTQGAPAGTAVVCLFEEANEYLDRFGSDAAGILVAVGCVCGELVIMETWW